MRDTDISIRPFYVYTHVHCCSSASLVVLTTALSTDIVDNVTMVRHITIVTGGVEQYKWFMEAIKSKFPNQEWHDIDLRAILKKDPATTIGHKEDWEWARTQQVVIAQTEFANVIVEAVTIVDGIADLVWMNCNTGYHRASVAGKVLESQLNSLVDGQGVRLYNTQLFMFHEVQGRKQFYNLIGDVSSWIMEPWPIEADYDGTKKSLFGYAAAIKKQGSARSWNRMNDLISQKHDRGVERTHGGSQSAAVQDNTEGDDRGSSPRHPMPPRMRPPTPGQPPPMTGSVACSTAKSSADNRINRLSSAYPVGGRPSASSSIGEPCPPIDPPPSSWNRNHQELEPHPSDCDAAESDNLESDDYDASSRRRSPSAQSRPRSPSLISVSHASHESQDLPPWATFDRDVTVWWSLLEFWRVDTKARESLFALAQHSDQGREYANDLIGKLIKKKNDGATLHNSSGFVFSCVMNARIRLAPEWNRDREYYGGDGERPWKRSRR